MNEEEVYKVETFLKVLQVRYIVGFYTVLLFLHSLPTSTLAFN